MKVFYLTTNKKKLRILKWFASLTWLALKTGWALGIWLQHSDAALVLCTVFAHKHSFVGNVGWHHILTMELDCFGNNVRAASGSRESEIREMKKTNWARSRTNNACTTHLWIAHRLKFTSLPIFTLHQGNKKQVPEECVCPPRGRQRAGSAHSREEGILLLVNFHVVFKLGAVKLFLFQCLWRKQVPVIINIH